ncbi:uncharacterized protein Z520_02908 [Fonsecaea multimorphosa CBS 102226]|uniref:PHD-type domain-containing protein n=1 Tax=Fonsecaea multimorphosa CBS 102226 TaxID=1442371 RepID=A0A0D2HHH8_9EURO|nr:uncharacterized protein Z520_02908 [Fonsecaea multimorphosa CBS 102226]KIY01356.1 hypothetical protein Z520_02908 [Fonsecaea multimorphosa CBS 102226]OAL28632.1 hypothetical protein AYO22_02826 [Fonsecaea multimorphosa]
MLTGSSGRRRHTAKRRKIDATDTATVQSDSESRLLDGLEQAAGLPESPPPARPPPRAVPIVPPPDAPFRPGALQLWVVRDAEGKKQLVSEMVPGCRHWRIGDPNVPFCFECKKEDKDVMGCKTCKKSYHLACLGEEVPTEDTSTRAFYCPTCIERGWDKHPPPEILPLTPLSSREGSPAPRLSTAKDVAAAESHQQLGQMAVSGHQRHVNTDHDQPGQDSQRVCEVSAPEASLPVPKRLQSQQPPGNDYNPSLRHSSGPMITALQQREAVSKNIREDQSSSPQLRMVTESTINQANATSRSTKAKSRYQTMPDEVDQALTVIYRELESVAALKQDIAVLQDRLRATEQARQILEGRLALERSGGMAVASKEAEIKSLKQQLAELRRSNEMLVEENSVLKQRLQDQQTSHQAGLEEMEALKASLRRLLGN